MPERPELREALESEEAWRFRASQVARLVLFAAGLIGIGLIDWTVGG